MSVNNLTDNCCSGGCNQALVVNQFPVVASPGFFPICVITQSMSKVRQLNEVIDISDSCVSAVFDEADVVSSVNQEVTQNLVDNAEVDKEGVVHSTFAQEQVATPNVTGLANDRDLSGVIQVNWNQEYLCRSQKGDDFLKAIWYKVVAGDQSSR